VSNIVKDYDILQNLISDFDIFTKTFKESMGEEFIALIKEDIIYSGGPTTQDTDPMNPRGINPQWPPLSNLTIQLKGSSAIMIDTQQLINTIRWQIEDSEWDNQSNILKVGWFEDSGNRAYVAAIHEFGLTGSVFRTPDGNVMGGAPVGRTPQARANIRHFFKKRLGITVSGRIIIPERSMLRKAVDLVVPKLADYADTILLKILRYYG